MAFGGEGNDASPSGVFGEVEAWDTLTGQWILLTPMPTPRHGIGAATLAGRIHVPGGGPQEGFGLTTVHEVYDASQELVAPLGVPALGVAGHLALGLALVGVGLLAVRARTSREERRA